KRERPTFVLGGQNKEDQQEREPKNRNRRDTLRCLLFLIRHPHVVEAHLTRHGLRKDLLESLPGLSGAVARSGRSIDLRRVSLVVAHCEFRAASAPYVRHCA